MSSRRVLWLPALAMGLLRLAHAQAPLGLFEGHQDVGAVLTPGTAQYDAASKTYTLSASGENMWATADEFQFVWKKVSGDIRIAADISFIGEGGDPHRKAVLIVRQSLDADSPYGDMAVHGVGLTSLQARAEKGSATHEIQANINAPKRVALEKRGQYFYTMVAGEGEELRFAGGAMHVAIEGPFYVGIGVCAHNKDRVEKAAFSNVQLSKPVGKVIPFSTLETVTVSSTDRRVTLVSPKRIESPVWLREGDALVYKSEGKYYRVPTAGGAPTPAEAAPPSEEHSPAPAPSDEFSNWYPHVSPDGSRMVMLSAAKDAKTPPRNADVMLRILTLATGRVTVLANLMGGEGTIDAPSWSPDSKKLAFVSYQVAAAH